MYTRPGVGVGLEEPVTSPTPRVLQVSGATVPAGATADGADGGARLDPTTGSTKRRRSLVRCTVIPAALLVGACGGAGASPAAEAPAAEVSAEPTVVPPPGTVSDDEELTSAMDALDIETRIGILAEQLDGTYEITSSSTAVVSLDGDVDHSGAMACIVVESLGSPGDVITVIFPNGEVICEVP